MRKKYYIFKKVIIGITIYKNNKYGVIAEYSLAWPDTKVLYNQEELKLLQDSIHKDFNRFLLIDKMVKMSKY